MGNRVFKSGGGRERKEPLVHGVRYLPNGHTVPKHTTKLQIDASDVGTESEGLCTVQGSPSSPPITPEGESPWSGWMGHEYTLENVVMSGGGSKGYAYIGALKV